MSTRAIRGPLRFDSFATVSGATYTIVNEGILLVTRTATGACTITLPASLPANPLNIRQIVIVDSGGLAGTNAITVAATGSDTINGGATVVVGVNNAYIVLVDTGAGKWISAIPQTSGAGSFSTLVLSGLLTEAFADGITAAAAAGGRAGAIATAALTKQLNRVTSSAAWSPTGNPPSNPDGVVLMAAAPGLEIELINATANPIALYGAGIDTVNTNAGSAGMILPPYCVVECSCTLAGAWHVEGAGIGYAPSTNLPTDLTQDTITAHAGGTQAAGYQLVAEINRITVCATIGDSVLLPLGSQGMGVVVINHGAKSAQVYGAGTDTIDDVATATGVAQMAGSVALYFCTTAAPGGKWYSEGIGTGYSGGLPTLCFTDNVAGFVGGGQGSAVALTTSVNRVTGATLTPPYDSLKLPASAPGMAITVINSSANPVQLFGAGTDTINGVATATGVTQMQSSIVVYSCSVAGQWFAEGIGGGFSGALGVSGSLGTVFAVNTITASGVQGGTTLAAAINRVTAGGGAGVTLPPSGPGLVITVTNATTSAVNVYPDTGGVINNLPVNAFTPLPAGATAQFWCSVAGTWHTLPASPREVNTAITTAGAGTLTAAGIVGGLITRSGPVAAFSDATDTGTAIVAALHGAVAGQSWELTIENTSAFTQTITNGANVMVSGITTVPPGSWARFLVTYTMAPNTVTMAGFAAGPNVSNLLSVPPLTATGFRVTDGTNAYITVNTQTTTDQTVDVTISNTAPTIVSAGTSSHNLTKLASYTLTLTGGVLVTALNGLSKLVSSPTVSSGVATTVTTASTMQLNGPLPAGAGPVTFTNSFALDIPTWVTNGTTGAGIRVAAPSAATTNWAILVASGNIGLPSNGIVQPSTGVGAFSVSSSTLTIGSLGSVVAPNKSAAGAVTDGQGGNLDGSFVVSSGDTKLYARVSGAWKSVAIAGFSIPKYGADAPVIARDGDYKGDEDNFDETLSPLSGRPMKPGDVICLVGDRYYADGGLHAYACSLEDALELKLGISLDKLRLLLATLE